MPAVRSLKRRGIATKVVFWEHATAVDLREGCDEFVALDPHLEEIGRVAGPTTAALGAEPSGTD